MGRDRKKAGDPNHCSFFYKDQKELPISMKDGERVGGGIIH